MSAVPVQQSTTPLVTGVTSAGSGIGYSVIESLKRAGDRYRLVGFDVSPANASMSRLKHRALLPRVADETDYERALLSLVQEFSLEILVPCLDSELSVIARLRPRLLELGCVPIVSDTTVTRLSADKEGMAEFCATRGLPFVRTESLASALSRAADLQYPVIVKPRNGSASDGAQVVTELAGLPKVSDVGSFVVQDYLPPRELDGTLAMSPTRAGLDQRLEVSVQYALNPNGTTLGRFASMNQLKNGVPVVVEQVSNQVDLSGADRIVAALVSEGARGPINLQGRIGADGAPMYFEMNARFTGITRLRSLFGFREVEAVIESFVGTGGRKVADLLRPDESLIGFRPVDDVVVAREQASRATTPLGMDTAGALRPLGRVAVTGASGYLGSLLVDRLRRDPSVQSVTLLRRQSAFVVDRVREIDDRVADGSMRDFTRGISDAVDTVFHLAALRPDQSHAMHEMFASNPSLTGEIAAGARAAGAQRLIVASTQAVYGTSRPPLWDESMPPMAETAYGSSKWASEMVASAAAGAAMMTTNVRIARLFGVADGMRWSELPHQWVERALRGEPLTIVGDGKQRMDLLDVVDAVDALMTIARCNSPEIAGPMNVGGGNPISLLELANVIAAEVAAHGAPGVVLERRAAAAPQPSFGMSIERAREVTGWEPTHPAASSIRRVVLAARGRKSEFEQPRA